MTPKVATEDLVDAHAVAEILGLAQPNTVSVYQRRHAEMPRPVVDLGRGRPKLWLRPEIERWAATMAAKGRTRPGRRVARSVQRRPG
jgi:glutathione-regulated potassium-efflux system ancillary protein KefG